jgi:hypothetical protein
VFVVVLVSPNYVETYTPIIVMQLPNFGLLYYFSLRGNLHPYYCDAVPEIRLLINCSYRNTCRALFVFSIKTGLKKTKFLLMVLLLVC